MELIQYAMLEIKESACFLSTFTITTHIIVINKSPLESFSFSSSSYFCRFLWHETYCLNENNDFIKGSFIIKFCNK